MRLVLWLIVVIFFAGCSSQLGPHNDDTHFHKTGPNTIKTPSPTHKTDDVGSTKDKTPTNNRDTEKQRQELEKRKREMEERQAELKKRQERERKAELERQERERKAELERQNEERKRLAQIALQIRAELNRMAAVDWSAKADFELYHEVTTLITDLEDERKGEEFLAPFRIIFSHYFARIAKMPAAKGWPFQVRTDIVLSITLPKFAPGQALQMEVITLKSSDKTLPIMLAEMAKRWPVEEVFCSGILRFRANPWNLLTPFQQLVTTEGDRAIAEVRSLLANPATKNALRLDTAKNNPFAYAKTRKMLETLRSRMGARTVQAKCKLDDVDNTLHTLECAILNHASLEVIKALIEFGADVSAQNKINGTLFYAVSLAAKITPLDIFTEVKNHSGNVLRDNATRKRTFFMSLANHDARVPKSILAASTEFAATTFENKGALQHLLARDLDGEHAAARREIFTTLVANGAPILSAQGGFAVNGGQRLTVLGWAAQSLDNDAREKIFQRAGRDNSLVAAVNEKSEEPAMTPIQILLKNYSINADKRSFAISLINAGAHLTGDNAKILNAGSRYSPLALAAVEHDEVLLDAIIAEAKRARVLPQVLGENSGSRAETALQNLLFNYSSNQTKRSLAIKLINAGADLVGPNARVLNAGQRYSLLALAAVEQDSVLLDAILAKAALTGNRAHVVNEQSANRNETALQQVLFNYSNNDQKRSIALKLIDAGADLVGLNARVHNAGHVYSLLSLAAVERDPVLVDALIAKAGARGNRAELVSEKSGSRNLAPLQILLADYSRNVVKREIAIKIINAGADLLGDNAKILNAGRTYSLLALAVVEQDRLLVHAIVSRAERLETRDAIIADRSSYNHRNALEVALSRYIGEENRKIVVYLMRKGARADGAFIGSHESYVNQAEYDMLLREALML